MSKEYTHLDYLADEYLKEEPMVFKYEPLGSEPAEEKTTAGPNGEPIIETPIKKQNKRFPKRRKLTPEERKLCQKLIKNKIHYLDKEIDGKGIWGIGPNAITLYDEVFPAREHHANMRTHAGKQYFHNYFKKINRENSFDNGVEMAKKIVKKYGKLGNWD